MTEELFLSTWSSYMNSGKHVMRQRIGQNISSVCRVIVIVRQQFADVDPDYFLKSHILVCRLVCEMLSRSDIDPIHNSSLLTKKVLRGENV